MHMHSSAWCGVRRLRLRGSPVWTVSASCWRRWQRRGGRLRRRRPASAGGSRVRRRWACPSSVISRCPPGTCGFRCGYRCACWRRPGCPARDRALPPTPGGSRRSRRAGVDQVVSESGDHPEREQVVGFDAHAAHVVLAGRPALSVPAATPTLPAMRLGDPQSPPAGRCGPLQHHGPAVDSRATWC